MKLEAISRNALWKAFLHEPYGQICFITNVWFWKHACIERTNEINLDNIKTNVFSTKTAYKAEENNTNWFVFNFLNIYESQLEREQN